MTTKYEFHEAANIFPLMSKKEFDGLVADIKKHGQRDAIVIYKGKILDGRNRYKACRKLGIAPVVRSEEFDGTLTNAVDYVMSQNLHRRQLTPSQRGMVAAKSMDLYRKAALKRKQEAGKTHGRGQQNRSRPNGLNLSGQSRDHAAKVAGCSGATVERCNRVLSRGTPELVDAVEENAVSANTADLLTTYTKKEQRGFLKGGKEAWTAAAKRAAPAKKSKTKKKPDAIIKDTVKAINQIMDLVRKKKAGVSAQRDNTIKRLTSAREWIKAAGEFL